MLCRSRVGQDLDFAIGEARTAIDRFIFFVRSLRVANRIKRKWQEDDEAARIFTRAREKRMGIRFSMLSVSDSVRTRLWTSPTMGATHSFSAPPSARPGALLRAHRPRHLGQFAGGDPFVVYA